MNISGRKLRTALIPVALIPVVVLTTAASCGGGSNGQQQEQQQQNADTSSLEQSQPLPHFGYSQIRQTAIDAETISAEGTQTTSFFMLNGVPDPVFSCPSLGEPVANTASLSNPLQPYQGSDNTDGSDVVDQMDPNGVYAPTSSSGTYVICVNSSGAKYLEYWEGEVMTVTSGATWDSATHSLKVLGAPTAVIHTKAGS